MLNPDGVAVGNSRVNLDGYDLNRCWDDPTVGGGGGCEIEPALRELKKATRSKGGVLAFLDLHAHSRRHGVFTLSNPRTEALPDILSQSEAIKVFDRSQCCFSYHKSKSGSARCVAWKNLGIDHAHTIESTYAKAKSTGVNLVTPTDLSTFGADLVRACVKLAYNDGSDPDQPASQLKIKKGIRKALKTKGRRGQQAGGGPSFQLVL